MQLHKDLQRFWAKVVRRGEDDCWEWQARCHPEGYGWFWLDGRNWGAHRALVQMISGRVLRSEEHVRHSCDNPPCVNPRHLQIGSHSDNMADKVARGRVARPLAKIGFDQAEEIRRRYASGGVTQQELGEDYGISQGSVWGIVRHKTWQFQ